MQNEKPTENQSVFEYIFTRDYIPAYKRLHANPSDWIKKRSLGVRASLFWHPQ